MIPPTTLSAESARLQILEAENLFRSNTYIPAPINPIPEFGPAERTREQVVLAEWYRLWMARAR